MVLWGLLEELEQAHGRRQQLKASSGRGELRVRRQAGRSKSSMSDSYYSPFPQFSAQSGILSLHFYGCLAAQVIILDG